MTTNETNLQTDVKNQAYIYYIHNKYSEFVNRIITNGLFNGRRGGEVKMKKEKAKATTHARVVHSLKLANVGSLKQQIDFD